MKKYIKKFRKDLHKLASNDSLRPNMQHLFFKDGSVYVTDAHILLVQSLADHNFTEEETELLNGYCIHRNTFAMLMKFDILKVESAGEIIAQKDETKVIFKLKEYGGDKEINMPSFEDVLRNAYNDLEEAQETSVMAFNPILLYLLTQCMFTCHSIKIKHTKHNRALIVESNTEECAYQKAIIMPVMIHD